MGLKFKLFLGRKSKYEADGPGNYELFIGSDNSDDSWAFITRDHNFIGFVSGLIQMDPEETETNANTLSHYGAFSPMPPVKTRVSNPPRAAAKAPIHFFA
jgi:hypothetical protein